MDGPVLVYVDIDGEPVLAGRMWPRAQGGRESATFIYDDAWLIDSRSFALDPEQLPLSSGTQATPEGRAMFGGIGDSAPDTWGRTLMRRAARRKYQAEGRPARTLMEADYLMMVDDESRQGALRFALEPGGPFLAEKGATQIPPLVDLPKLLNASQALETDPDSQVDLRVLLAPGSSLGGARPKASVRDCDGSLMIAKFPKEQDEVNICLWEAVALTLAERAGLCVPEWRVENVLGRDVICLKRFDRKGGERVPFLSAMSLIGAADNEDHSYLEIVDGIRRHGEDITAGLEHLWQRTVFNVLISNTDDHLRNHGFLRGAAGWRLSPAYDMNPTPPDIKGRYLSLALDDQDTTASYELAFSVVDYYGIPIDEAAASARRIAEAVSQWRSVAEGLRIPRHEIDQMAEAFEHDDLTVALQGPPESGLAL